MWQDLGLFHIAWLQLSPSFLGPAIDSIVLGVVVVRGEHATATSGLALCIVRVRGTWL